VAVRYGMRRRALLLLSGLPAPAAACGGDEGSVFSAGAGATTTAVAGSTTTTAASTTCIADGVVGAPFLHGRLVEARLGGVVDPMSNPEATTLIANLVTRCMGG
jgi:hypothetical protein